jgi:hypothetical protein
MAKKKKKINKDKRRNPHAYEMLFMSGNGKHKDKRKESLKKACRRKVTED